MDNLGVALRKFRKKRGMTLVELARKTDLSVGFISKVERGINSLSFNNLQKICYALGITTNELVTPTDGLEEELIIRHDKRKLIYNYSGVIKYESICAYTNFAIDVLTLDGSNEEYSTTQHSHDELGIVAYGKLLVILRDTEHILAQGDVILIPAGEKHHVQKLNEGICESYWIKIYNK